MRAFYIFDLKLGILFLICSEHNNIRRWVVNYKFGAYMVMQFPRNKSQREIHWSA